MKQEDLRVVCEDDFAILTAIEVLQVELHLRLVQPHELDFTSNLLWLFIQRCEGRLFYLLGSQCQRSHRSGYRNKV